MKITILCPYCKTPCQQWKAKYGTTNWCGCIHVISLISIDGTEQFEFASIPAHANTISVNQGDQ